MRTNAFSKSVLIALVSDLAATLHMTSRFATFADHVETVGLDNAAPELITDLMYQLAAAEQNLADTTAYVWRLEQSLAGFTADDMAVSAAEAAQTGRHAAPKTGKTVAARVSRKRSAQPVVASSATNEAVTAAASRVAREDTSGQTIKATPVMWEPSGPRLPAALKRCANSLKIDVSEIVEGVRVAIAAGIAPSDAIGAWYALDNVTTHGGSVELEWTEKRIEAARAMGWIGA